MNKLVLMKRVAAVAADDPVIMKLDAYGAGAVRIMKRVAYGHVSLAERVDPDRATDGDVADLVNTGGAPSSACATLHGLAEAICVADPTIGKADALRWLLNTAHGRALFRLHKAHEHEEPTMTREEMVADIAKRGAVPVAKAIVDGGIPGFSEHEFTGMVHKQAQAERRAGETADQAFARYFSADTDEGRTIRKAHQMTKRFPDTMPTAAVQVGGETAFNVNDPKDALAQLYKLAAALRAASPELTIAQAFSRVYTATENAELVARERMQNRPVGRVVGAAASI